MLNIEKNYKKILENKDSFAVNKETGEVLNCFDLSCDDCKLYCINNDYEAGGCDTARICWLFEEYIEN